jgi:hypothetical protein
MNMNREQLIRSIETARVRGVVVPTEVFGRKIFVKTTKHDIVAQIRNEFKEAQPTNMRFRIDQEASLAIVEPATGKRGGKIHDHLKAEPGVPVPKRGRPFSKNQPPAEPEKTEKKAAKVLPLKKVGTKGTGLTALPKNEETKTQPSGAADPNHPSGGGETGPAKTENGDNNTQH